MSTDATINLQDLQCLRQDRGSDGSDPYIWPALVSIDSSLRVNVLTPYNESRVIIQSGMTNGQTAAIPAIVGAQTTRLEGDLTANHLILVVALWERRDTPDNVVSAGYSAFSDSLGTGIRANLLGLGSSDPAAQQAAIDAVKTTVKNGVTDAISNSLTWYQKAEIAAGIMHLDDLIDNSSTAFSSLIPQTFAVSFGGSIGGRLLFYRDNTQNGTGDVDTPGVIGQGGWEEFKFLFSGGNGIIYAVNQQGQLLFYRDNTQNGTGDVDTPSVIGLGGWTDFQFLFSGGNGIIYASEPALTPANSYVVDANLQLATVVCEAESLAVNQDQVAVNGLKAQLQELQKEFAQAPASEKPAILADIREFEKDELAPAESKLAADTKALEACRARSGVPTSKKTAASAESPAVNRVTVPV